MFNRLRRTKIVTTLGPATDKQNNLEKVILAGADVVRMNFSHGTPEDHKRRANRVREIEKKHKINLAILGDLQGPKIRISTFKCDKVFLKKGDIFILNPNIKKGEGNEKQVGIDYKNLHQDVRPGDILLLDDGKIQLKVVKVFRSEITSQIIVGGELSSNKGINKLGGGLSAEALTEKDKKDILLASEIGVDYLAISFPRCGEDLNYARRLARKANCFAKIVAKIERAEAVANQTVIDDIITSSDAVMVARGDLGVEIGDSKLVGIQKNLISRSRQLNRVVITATQMMESMINSPMPTRAEVMDVANAVLDGTDAVMLSAETASGKYPAETVSNMSSVCYGAEKISSISTSKHRLDMIFESIEETISMSAMYAANHLKGITAIVTMTKSGSTALMTSRISSGLPIFAMSSHKSTLNITSLYRGVHPMYFDTKTYANNVSAAQEAISLLHKKGYIKTGDTIILTQGDVMSTVGSTNTVRIIKL